VLPEIIFLAELENTLRGDADFIVPDIPGFLIVQIDGRIQAFWVESHGLREEFPCPRNGLLLEIVAEGEVAEHFKECAVTGCFADVLKIARTDALLAGRHAAARRDLLSGKIRLQRSHAGIDDQQAVVIVRDERKALHPQAALAFKIAEEHLTQFIYAILFHGAISFPCRSSAGASSLRTGLQRSSSCPVPFLIRM
jgi:hypothetical protein